jgi:hypothetical protein
MKTISRKHLDNMTISELEVLIARIMRRVLREELGLKPRNGKGLSKEFLATFGAWKDDRPADNIIDEIYSTRTISMRNAL